MRAVVVGVVIALAVVLWPTLPDGPVTLGTARARRRGLADRLAHQVGPPAGLLGQPAGRVGRPTGFGPLSSRRRANDRADEVLGLLDAIAPALRAGLPPGDALRAVRAASDRDGVASALLAAADQGAPLGSVWRRYADRTASPDIALMAAAWSLCDALGSPLAPTVSTVAGMIRQRRTLEQRIDVAVAGPRATMRLLIALPLVGPVLALSVGVSPAQLYATPAGLAPLLIGVLLLLVGWRWSRRLIAGVFRERRDG